MDTKIASAVCVSPRPCGAYLRYLLPGILLFGLVQQANAESVRDCAPDRMALNQRLVERMPADPRSGQAVLRLGREAADLCRKGDSSAGRAKLHEAASQLAPSAPDVPNPKR